MVGEILTAGDIGRLKAYGANAPVTSTIPMFYNGKAYTVTPDQIASGASAVDGPASATDGVVALFNGTTGKIIKNSTTFPTVLARCTAQVDATTTTLANVTGLSFTVVPGTYQFYADLDTTCGGTGGVKLAFNYTTTVLSAIYASGLAYTASAVARSKTNTTTTQTSIVASNTAFTNVILSGTMVVTTGGTVDLQFAENSANSTSSVLVGSYMQFTRIA